MYKLDERSNLLFKKGFKYNGEYFIYNDVMLHGTVDVLCSTDEEFDKIMNKVDKHIEEVKKCKM